MVACCVWWIGLYYANDKWTLCFFGVQRRVGVNMKPQIGQKFTYRLGSNKYTAVCNKRDIFGIGFIGPHGNQAYIQENQVIDLHD